MTVMDRYARWAEANGWYWVGNGKQRLYHDSSDDWSIQEQRQDGRWAAMFYLGCSSGVSAILAEAHLRQYLTEKGCEVAYYSGSVCVHNSQLQRVPTDLSRDEHGHITTLTSLLDAAEAVEKGKVE